MQFLEFQQAFTDLPIISAVEIEKHFPGYDENALTRWQKKGYIIKIRNQFYRLVHPTLQSVEELFLIANQIYAPSYVSLHSALRWYNFIPEGVFSHSSVSTRKTQIFSTSQGNFSYRKMKNSLFFGYRVPSISGHRYRIADPMKAILDLLYLYPQYKHESDFYELRLNQSEIQLLFEEQVWEDYLTLFDSKSLGKRARDLTKFLSL